jgi:heat shock protein HslJ
MAGQARLSAVVGVLLSLIVPGCGPYHGTPPSRAGVTGSVTYRERSAFPPDAVVRVQLSDVSRQDAAAIPVAQATITPAGRQFPEPGKVAGSGSCNRFFGTVSIDGNAIAISPLGTTRMACAEAVAMQEVNYMRALPSAERYLLQGTALLIYVRGMPSPLRFIRGR